jgi:hypothetical protein
MRRTRTIPSREKLKNCIVCNDPILRVGYCSKECEDIAMRTASIVIQIDTQMQAPTPIDYNRPIIQQLLK